MKTTVVTAANSTNKQAACSGRLARHVWLAGWLLAGLAMPSRGADQLALWYRAPAAMWTEALPIGNGS
ncbi:MAG: hypothetical protein NTV49_09920, partial [Kiritimatiellaeota bacterium]|nr:hypothetical protein [Kiritimatiellota bacterium]